MRKHFSAVHPVAMCFMRAHKKPKKKRNLGIFYACARHENVSDALNNFADEMKLSYSIRRTHSHHAS